MELNIIHLPSRLDRLQLLENQLDEQKVRDYKIWPGILDNDNPKRGIAKAHKQIIRWAKDQGLDSIIIAEDDLKFTAPGAFAFFIENEPTNFDIYLGGNDHRTRQQRTDRKVKKHQHFCPTFNFAQPHPKQKPNTIE